MIRSLPLIALLLLLPASAQAAQITGNPLSVSASDDTGALGVSFTGSGTTEFFGSSVDTTTGVVTPASRAGFGVVTVDGSGNLRQYGPRNGSLAATSAPVVRGTGSAADPFVIVQTFSGGGAVDIRQELTYVNGRTTFGDRLTVRNVSGAPLTLRASMGADLAGGGSDTGTGVFEGGPPRFVGGFNTTVGSVAGLSEVTPWTHYEEGGYSDVLERADANPGSDHLQDRIEPTEVDNGAAVQWDGAGFAPSDEASFAVDWRFTRTFDVTPATQSLTTGDTASLEVTSQSTDGRPQANTHVRFSVLGVNTATGDARTGADGQATLEYVGGDPGTDTVSVYADSNDNGQRDVGEPQREVVVQWTGLEGPTFAQNVNVRPVKGRVLVKLPKGTRAAAGTSARWARAAAIRFTPLKVQTRLPVGSEVDTARGTIQLTARAGLTNAYQTAQFYSGRFQILQKSREQGITEMRMTGALSCRSEAKSAAARSRRLWGHGKGRFRTRGRNSTATVRGTWWLQKDTCSGTTTTVREGVVTVRDFAKRKNVVVKAPKSYRARAGR